MEKDEKMVKVSLLYPSISSIGFNSYGKSMDESWINHGLCSISSYLKKEGFSADLIDLRRLKNWKHFREIILTKKPDVIGITMLSVDYNPAIKSIDIIKETRPNTIIVVGGPHPSIMSDELKNNKNIDHIIIGEGEISFAELLNDIEKGNKPEKIINGKIQKNLDLLPFADRDLFSNFEHAPNVEGFKQPFVTIIAGRGCRFNCSFCQPAERLIFGKKVRRRSPTNVIDELLFLKKKYNFKSLMIHDDCITEDKKWITEFCNLYRENGFTQPFICQSRADIICRHEKMVQIMANSGLKLFIIGFESGNQRVLNFLRKGTTVEQNYKAADICRKYGIKIWANYMLGIPTESKEEVMDTVTMIKNIHPDHCSPTFYTPHPGSDLFDYCIKNNLSLIKNHNSYSRNPTEAKIRGVDYNFLRQALVESLCLDLPFKNNKYVSYIENRLVYYLFCHPNISNIIKLLFKNNIN